MGLQSALSTALSGLSAAGTTIDAVGNNLANSNTVGYKASRATFSTQFMQTISLGAAPTEHSGGTNPRQLGLGTMVADITPDFSQGTIEISANPTDLAIQGEGFFVVEGSTNEHLYTRNGIFKMNAANELVTITGNRVLGYGIDDQFQIQRTILVPIEISLGGAAVVQATNNVYLEGTLTPTGDLADTAARIQTSVLGDGTYTAPTTALNVTLSVAPNVVGSGTSGASAGAGAVFTPGDYQYRLVYANDSYTPPPPATVPALSESSVSDAFTVTLAANSSGIDLTNIPTQAPGGPYDFTRIYRTTNGGSNFYYVGEIPSTSSTYADTLDDATLTGGTRPALNEDVLNGNYSYYVTFADTPGGPGVGIESRPSPLGGPLNVSNGRILLDNLPIGDPNEWQVRRIYRNLSTDNSTFHFVGEISGVTDPNADFTDNRTDADIMTEATIDPDGPKITANTLLTDILRRDGSVYEQLFDLGTLQFAGKKGGRTLDTKELDITASTTVLELIDFMEDAWGIQDPTADPFNPIPPDAGSGFNPGGMVTSDGRIVFTGNNGTANAVDVGASGLQLVTASSTGNVNLPFGSIQAAIGESAVTDFVAYDSLGIPLRVRLTMVLEERDSTSTTYRWFADSPDNDPVTGVEIAVGTGQITFDGDGNFVGSTEATVSIDRRNVSSASPLEFELDFTGISGLHADRSTLAVSRQDGSPPGVLSSFIVGEDGRIRGVFSNGVTRDIGQIRLARFANPAGLEQRGENLFGEGVNSGLPVEGDPGQQGIGTLIAGAVELSNSDIGGNLVDLILASTMYRGNTRVITTAQQMIDELLSLRR